MNQDQNSTMNYIVDQITVKNQLHSKKIIKNLAKFDEAYFNRANDFLKRYVTLLQNEGKTLDYSIDCYLQMIADVNYESVQFFQTGEYTSKSFDEVNQRVYNNPNVMEYYMHGLLLSQFLWTHHYDILLYFNKIINQNAAHINNYLEVGGGHGLYISEAIGITGAKANYDLVDISKSSLDIAKRMISNDKVNYILSDVFEYFPEHKYDFITMGEVLEHVEDPVALLKKLNSLLSDNGKLFITTPTNAPAIDHIFLFRNADDIRKVIHEAGFNIENEFSIYSEDMPAEKAEKFKVSMMYAGVLVKK
jgi:2-polyprenyl-3-methyl-5-hydroxy-6-metoxy-1,4-benzoquinol methylase